MGFKMRVHTTRTTVVQPQPFRRTIEQVHLFCFVFSTAHCPPYFVNMMYFFREKNANIRNMVSQPCPSTFREHTEYGVSTVSIYCFLPFLRDVFLWFCTSTHCLTCTFQEWPVFTDSYAVDCNKTVRAEVVFLGRTHKPHPPSTRPA